MSFIFTGTEPSEITFEEHGTSASLSEIIFKNSPTAQGVSVWNSDKSFIIVAPNGLYGTKKSALLKPELLCEGSFNHVEGNLRCSCIFNNHYVIAGEKDIFYSLNGKEWQKINILENGNIKNIIVASGKLFISTTNGIYRSEDISNWSLCKSALAESGIFFVNNRLMFCAQATNFDRIAYHFSDDLGNTWKTSIILRNASVVEKAPLVSWFFNSFAYSDGYYYACGNSFINNEVKESIYVSQYGYSWGYLDPDSIDGQTTFITNIKDKACLCLRLNSQEKNMAEMSGYDLVYYPSIGYKRVTKINDLYVFTHRYTSSKAVPSLAYTRGNLSDLIAPAFSSNLILGAITYADGFYFATGELTSGYYAFSDLNSFTSDYYYRQVYPLEFVSKQA